MEVVSATDLPGPETVDITFHGVEYALTVAIGGSDVLVVEIEQKDDLARWRGEFSAKYVEDITSKTGNFKRFPVFVRMLASAARQQSDSVFIDLLTYSDLEALKARKASTAAAPGQQQQQQQARQSAANSKRYLILTYCAEFDRVHYPLPLLHEDIPDPARLMSTIQQLRRQLQQQQQQQQGQQARLSNGGMDARARSGGVASTSAADGIAGGSGGLDQRVKGLSKERDLLRSRLEAAEAELERERGLHRRELRRRAKEAQEAQQEVQRLRQQVAELQARCKQLSAAAEQDGSRRAGPAAAAPLRRHTTDSSSRWSQGSSANAYLAGGPRSKYPVRSGPPVYSRDASRGSSPGGSRTQSPSYSRPWANGSSSRQASPSRPSSAPPKQRFDPTEYVRQKKEKERQLAAQQRSRNPSPARSHNPSGYSTPTGQPASRRSTNSRDGPSSRPASVERTRAASIDRPRAASIERARPAAAGSSARPPARAVERAQSGTGRSAGQLVRTPSGRDAINSPGRALQNVRQKLTEYVQKQQAPVTAPSSVAEAPVAAAAEPAMPEAAATEANKAPVAAGSVFEDASTEIADIDSRLHALQNFLKMAKAGGS